MVAARRSGIHRTTLWRWKQRWLALNQNAQLVNVNRPARKPGKKFRWAAVYWQIPTDSSRPHRSPRALRQCIVDRIVYWRRHKGRCAGVVHAHCIREGTKVSLSSVKRVLKRLGFVVRRKWQRYRLPVPRPLATAPGELVQTDTIHLVHITTKRRVYHLYPH